MGLYRVIHLNSTSTEFIQMALNDEAKNEWRVVSITPMDEGGGGTTGFMVVLFGGRGGRLVRDATE